MDWYESLESSVSNPGLRSGIFLEEITRVERIGYQSKMEHMYGPSAFYLFGIYTCRKEEPYVMKCADAGMLNDWLKQLSKLLRDVRQLKRTDRKKAKIAETVYTMHNTPESLSEISALCRRAWKIYSLFGDLRSRHDLFLIDLPSKFYAVINAIRRWIVDNMVTWEIL